MGKEPCVEDMDRVKFWRGKKVLITGHTGFKGTWLTIWLHRLGATVLGYALKKYPNDAFYNSTNISKKIIDVRDNIEDNRALNAVFSKYQPDMVFHLAARSLVMRSYDEPLGTFNTNILGTANVLESIRLSKSVKAAVIITSDKCYKNNEWVWGYRENDTLGGHDPYSCSKGCAEMLVDCYRRSFFKDQSKYVASARAGNVIGGGDWSEDRLIPDCIKSLEKGEKIRVHNPGSTRPWQHVLEPLDGYLTLAEKMWTKKKYDEAWNFGPTLASIRPVGDIVDLLIEKWRGGA